MYRLPHTRLPGPLVVSGAVVFGVVAVWVVQASLGAFVLGEGSFWQRLFLPDANEFLGRVLLTALLVMAVGLGWLLAGYRRRTGEAEEAEERFRRLSSATFEDVAITENGKIVDVNDNFADTFGYGLHELIGLGAAELVSPGSLELVTAKMRAGDEEPYEAVCLKKSGAAFPAEIRGKAISYKGRLARVTAVRDITERREVEERYRSLFDNAPEGIFQAAPGGQPTVCNPALARMLGFASPDKALEDIEDIFKVLCPDPARREGLLASLRGEGEVYGFEVETYRGDGHLPLWLSLHAWGVGSYGNGAGYFEGQVEDVTGRRLAEEALRESQEQFEAAFDYAPIGMALVGADGRWLRVNPALCGITGYKEAELLEKTFQDLTHPDDLDKDLGYLKEMLAGSIRTYQMEKRYYRKNGSLVWIHLSVSMVRDAENAPAYFVSQIQDITDRKAREELLSHRASHDPLTGLANRSQFLEKLGLALGGRDASRSRVAVLYLDLDGFKAVNDSLGHEAGDQLLVEVAERLASCLRTGDLAARLGGDEFAVLLENVRSARQAVTVAERISREMLLPSEVAGCQTPITASIGVAFGSSGLSEPAALVKEADEAMYEAKKEKTPYRLAGIIWQGAGGAGGYRHSSGYCSQ